MNSKHDKTRLLSDKDRSIYGKIRLPHCVRKLEKTSSQRVRRRSCTSIFIMEPLPKVSLKVYIIVRPEYWRVRFDERRCKRLYNLKVTGQQIGSGRC